MGDWTRPLRTLEDAEAYFKAMGCSRFHMAREYPDRYAEYQRIVVDKTLERRWEAEEFEIKLANLSQPTGEAGWDKFLDVADLPAVKNDGEGLQRLLDAASPLRETLDDLGRLIVAERILGDGPVGARGGLVHAALGERGLALANSYVSLAESLLGDAKDADDRVRFQQATALLEEVRAEVSQGSKANAKRWRWWPW